MGYIPIFIVAATILFLWGMTTYHTLKKCLEDVNTLAILVQETQNEEAKQRYNYALRMYNATVKDSVAKFWAGLFGFKQIN